MHLAVTDDAGRTFKHGSLSPSWEGNVLDGHCILHLPDEQRVVDATIEQFREVGQLRMGPLVGMMAFPLTVGSGGANGSLPAGSQLPIRRAGLTLLYTMADDQATRLVLDHHAARECPDGHRLAGISLASATVDFLRRYPLTGKLDMSPYPRAAALLATTGDLPVETDESGNGYFSARDDSGQPRRLRLDELSMPTGTPQPAADGVPSKPGEPAGGSSPRLRGSPGPTARSRQRAREVAAGLEGRREPKRRGGSGLCRGDRGMRRLGEERQQLQTLRAGAGLLAGRR